MSEVDSQLSATTRKAVSVMQRRFPELSKRYCPDREEGFCGLTGGKCEFKSCPKMREQIKKHL